MSAPAFRFALATTLGAIALACSPRDEHSETGQIDPAAAAADSISTSTAGAENAPPKPNPQMQAVLDELAALQPKPITELSAP